MTDGESRRWRVDVTEVRFVQCAYVVEAETAAEADRLAARGETVDEWTTGREEVHDRHTFGEPTPHEG